MKLRIVSYDKRRSLKGNVYYVSFASDADIKFADRACKRLHNVTLKPFQVRSCEKTQCQDRFSKCNNEKRLSSSFIPSSSSSSSSSSPISFLSPPTVLTFFRDSNSSFVTSQSDSSRRIDETLEERAMRVLGSCIETSNRNEKQQVIENVKSCLQAMKTARQAADNLCQLYSRGSDCGEALNHLFQVHSTAFYLKVATSAQIKNLQSTGLRISWPDLANTINAFRIDVGFEQSFMAQMESTKDILSKIDS
ncbi:unnamed protein product, partial [Rotaria magnacalcarata]